MNKTLMLVICDFLLISMLALARFDEPDPEVERTIAREEQMITEDQELIEVLEMSLEAELASRADLSENLAEARQSLQDQAQALEERKKSLDVTQAELEKKAREAAELAAEKARLLEARQQLEAEQEALVAEKTVLEKEYDSTRKQLANADSERVELAKSVGALKEDASVARERLRRAEEDLARREAELAARAKELEVARAEAAKVAEEKQMLSQNLEVAEARRELLAANLETERIEKALLQEEKEQAFARTEQLSEGVTQLAQESGEIRKELERSRPLTMSQIYTRFKQNRATVRFVSEERTLLGTSSRTYTPRSILVTDSRDTYVIVHTRDTPFKLDREATRVLSVHAEIQMGERRYSVMQAGFLAADPRLLFVPVPKRLAEESGLEIFELSVEPERWEEAVLIDNDEGNFGRTEFRRLTSSERYLKMDRPVLGELLSDFAASAGDQVFSKSGEFIGVMVDSRHAAVVSAFLASAKVTMGKDFDANQSALTLDRLRVRVAGLPQEVR